VQVADLITWASAHSWKTYLTERDGTHPPYAQSTRGEDLGRGHDIIVLPEGTCLFPSGSACNSCVGCTEEGLVFTTERLLVGNLVAAIKECGHRGVAVKCDGTYKISYEGDWNLFSLGTHAVRYDKHSRDVVHSYRPFVFAYIKGESNATLRDLVMPSLLRIVRCVCYVSWCRLTSPAGRPHTDACRPPERVGLYASCERCSLLQ